MNIEDIITKRFKGLLSSRTSSELIQLLNRDKFNEFVMTNIGQMPFYYNTNLMYNTYYENYIARNINKSKL
jgi:hypothetical protein